MSLFQNDWREIWKYGERGFRYTNLDLGHLIGSLKVAMRLLGWQSHFVEISDEELDLLLGLNKNLANEIESEHPAYLILVIPSSEKIGSTVFEELGEDFFEKWRENEWRGTQNQLSESHTGWKLLKAVTSACKRKACKKRQILFAGREGKVDDPLELSENLFPAVDLSKIRNTIRTRRSATSMENIPIFLEQFLGIISSIVCTECSTYQQKCFPYDGLDFELEISAFLIYVMRVEGISPGYYLLLNDRSLPEKLRSIYQQHDTHCFEKVEHGALNLPLYCVRKATLEEVEKASHKVSCSQQIAKASAFTIGMACMIDEGILEEKGGHVYKEAHWLCGIAGQILYLESEMRGLQSSGMGCFLDKQGINDFLLQQTSLKTLYHFTIGHATKLSNYPPYDYGHEIYSLSSTEQQDL